MWKEKGAEPGLLMGLMHRHELLVPNTDMQMNAKADDSREKTLGFLPRRGSDGYDIQQQ